jgi:DNA polymerase-1
VSNCFLGLLYGMGKDKLAGQLGTTPMEAQTIKEALMTAVPSIKEISNVVKRELESGDFVRTWGGRVYYAEPAKLMPNGQLRTFAYKGLNVLVQGSASDETKEALLRYAESANGSRMLLQVHDELVITCHKNDAAREMENLRKCMTGLELDVPMLSEGEWGYRWGDMREYKE